MACGNCLAGVDRDRGEVIQHEHCAGCPLLGIREENGSEDEVSAVDLVAIREGFAVPALSLM